MVDYEQEVARLREERERLERDALYWIVVTLRDLGPMYSREVRDQLCNHHGVDLTVQRVWMMLRDLEREGHLVSELRQPPFPDCPSGGIIRRYFQLKDDGEVIE